jgi:hypothetical protein
MQALLNTIRAAGAKNVVAAEGLGYSSDLSGVGAGFGLSDPAGNLMYQLHLYPAQWQSAADGDARVQPVVAGKSKYPVYVGEFGTPSGADDPAAGVNGVPQQGAGPWSQDMLTWLDQHRYSWSAWSLNPDTPPSLVSDWNYTPTGYFGTLVKDNLTNHAVTASITASALSSLQVALQNATTEYLSAVATRSPGVSFALASYVDSYLAYGYAQQAANTQSAADWSRAEQYAWMAQGNALNDYVITGNPFALAAFNWDLSGYMFAGAVGTPETA